MFLQFSPVRRVKTVQKSPGKKESEEAAILSLAPFTPSAKVFFEDVKVGTEATRQLVIKNPSNKDVELYLTHLPSQEINVAFSWHRALIEANGDVVLCITWTPSAVCACREIITLEDRKRIKKDVPVVFKSIQVKQKKRAKAPTFPSKKIKSPPPAEIIVKQSPMRRVLPKIVETTPYLSEKMIFESNILPLRNLHTNTTTTTQVCKTFSNGKVLTDVEDKENVFDDSLEKIQTPFEKVLFDNSKQFVFTPLSSPNNFQPTICSSEEKSRLNTTNFSVRTYVINRENNVSRENLTYTKDLNNTSLKTIDFAQRNSFLCSSLKDESRKRKCSSPGEACAVKKMAAGWSAKPLPTPKRVLKVSGVDFKQTTWGIYCNDPFLYAATTTLDPFLALDLNYNGQWIDEQEERFTKWLNVLLTPPSDLQTAAVHPVNVAKIWRDCKQKEVTIAPTKEVVSSKCYTSARLMGLRKAAMDLFKTPEVVLVLRKVASSVESGKLTIRKDRDAHLDLGIQSAIMTLLLSYNPLWLRIGLETIYSTVIPLKSNSDIMGLSQFLLARFFRDPYLLGKHKTVLSNKYAADIKKFILKKYLTLVYFLDQAKRKKLIKHDPCLFCKNAPVKDSKEMLFQFCKEVIHAIGDITKYLKHLGYVVAYQQSFLDEFDFAVTNLGVDLRDGVRLTKTVEIVLLQNDLMQNMRVPAISRLQKIHNVKIAFVALEKSGFQLVSDINPRDIVDGHREKTLSFLWQILYKFEAPLLKMSVTTIQKWWKSLPIVIKRRIYGKERQKQRNAVLKIEKWYARLKLAKKLESLVVTLRKFLQELKREKAAIRIQSYFRMFLQKKKYEKIKTTVVTIQKYARKFLLKRQKAAILKIQHFLRGFIIRRRYLLLKSAVVTVEQRYVAKKLMQEQLFAYQQIKTSAICIQKWYRSLQLTRQTRNDYRKLLWAVKLTQTRFRATREAKLQRLQFLKIKTAVLFIESRFNTKIVRKEFLQLKTAAILIQRRYRAKKQHENYLRLKEHTIVVQRGFRAKKLMQKERLAYENLRKYTIFIQRAYRAKLLMKQQKKMHESALKIQSYYRMYREKAKYQKITKSVLLLQKCAREFLFKRKKVAALKIVHFLRGIIARKNYLKLKTSVAVIEEKYIARKLMQKQRALYCKLKFAAICVQRHYRSHLQKKRAAVAIQNWWRSLVLTKETRKRYLKLLWAVNVLQVRFRAQQTMIQQRVYYLQLVAAVKFVQLKFRTKLIRNKFLQIRNTTIFLQRCYKTKKQRNDFLNLRNAALTLQKRFRATRAMKQQRDYYQKLKTAVCCTQKRFRANQLMKSQRNKYKALKRAVIAMQRLYRTKKQRQNYLLLKRSAIYIQSVFKAKQQRCLYENLRKYTIFMQRSFKAKQQRRDFLQLRCSVIKIQRRFRANLLAKQTHKDYVALKNSAIVIQRQFRTKQLKSEFLKKRNAVLRIQRWYRQMKTRENYKRLQTCVVLLQRRFRAKKQREGFLKLRLCVVLMQRRYRALKQMRNERRHFCMVKQSAVVVQRRYRALLVMRIERTAYLEFRQHVVVIQRRFRALKLMRIERMRFCAMKEAVLCVEQRYIAYCQYKSYQKLKKSAIVIQRRYREYCEKEMQKAIFGLKLQTIKNIQCYARGFLARRKYGDLTKLEVLENLREKRNQERGALKIQAFWRGYLTRKAHPELTQIRKRSITATMNADQCRTLGYLKVKALETLSSDSPSLGQIILALQDLDYISRRCKRSCAKLCNVLSEEVYNIICGTGRSVPETTACNLSASILINFCKYPPTTEKCWYPQYIDHLLTVMHNCCDKESPLFCNLCTLLWRFAHRNSFKSYILKIPNINVRLDKIQKQVIRKQNMVARSRTKGQTFFAPYKKLPLPSLKPDWGLDLKDSPRSFTNAVHACDCLLRVLNLK